MSRFAAPSARDRGQILVVGAFAIALLIVALAVVLNSAAFTETLATDGDGGAAQDALRFERDTKAGVAGAMVAVNREEGDATKSDLDAAVADWETLTNAEASTRGTVVAVNVTSVDEFGSRIAQDNESRTFTDANGTADWTVVDGTKEVAQFTMRLNRSTLPDVNATNQFTINASKGTDRWRVTFADNGTDIVATVEKPGGSNETCSVTTNSTVVDLVNGRIGNESCPALAVTDEVGGTSYSINVENGDQATGAYELVVDKNVDDDDRFNADGPTVAKALWEITVEISYDSARVSYQTSFTVEVGEAHA